jgi:hypothetical protein
LVVPREYRTEERVQGQDASNAEELFARLGA